MKNTLTIMGLIAVLLFLFSTAFYFFSVRYDICRQAGYGKVTCFFAVAHRR